MKTITLKMILIHIIFQTIFLSASQANAQMSGEVVYKTVYSSDPSKFHKDTLHFNGTQLLFTENRDRLQWWTDEGYRVTIDPRNQSWFFDPGAMQTIERKYNFVKKRNEYTKQTVTPINWEILDEFKTIGNYRAQKATTVLFAPGIGYYTAVAWFTPEIPISGGPWYMWGLPGLIIEYAESNLYFTSMESIMMKPVGNLMPEGVEGIEEYKSNSKADRKKLMELLQKEGN